MIKPESGDKNFFNLHQFIEGKFFLRFITTLIVINAIILGLETYLKIMLHYGTILQLTDYIILWIFVVELTLCFIVYKSHFFRDPWSIFDTIVVGIAFIPANAAFSVLRVARVLRVLRLVSIFPRLRRVIEGLVGAIPGIASIGAILIIIMYVFAVMGTRLYGVQYPDWFGNIQSSIFSLFQIMTLEGWPDIVRTILKTHPNAWIFFVIYILIATFSVLNLFIAVIVDAMQKQHELLDENENHNALTRIEHEMVSLNKKIDQLKINQG